MNGPSAQDLKARVDLRDVVRACWGEPHRHRARYDVYASRWRDDGKRPSFTVYDTHFKDYGGDGTGGDVFAFLMLELRCDFKSALAWLADYLGERPTITTPTRRPHITTAHDEPPPPAWQQAATKALQRAQRYLWSGRADARRVLHYLREERGLTDATIKAAGYGYNPRWQVTRWHDPETGKAAYLAPGIIEPWYADGTLWALRVRCRTGGLAAALGIDDDQLGEATSPKYLNLSGSKQSGALYNGDHITPGADVLIVEGGFDATLAAQHLDMPVVTFGSATNHPNGRRLAQLEQAEHVFLLLDADDAGQQATQHLQRALGKDVSLVHLPNLPNIKDVTDFVVGHNGDLNALIEQARKPAWWVDGVPDAVRSALLTYFRPSTAPVIELINRAVNAGLLDSDDLTINALIEADTQLGADGVGVSAHSIRRVVSELTGYALHEIDPCPAAANQRGRASTHYRLASVDELTEMIMLWAAPRIYEKHHPTDDENGVVARPTPAMLHALGFDLAAAEQISAALDAALGPAYFNQDHTQEATMSAAYRTVAGLRRDLTHTASTALPAGWPLNTPAAYRAAFLRATNDPDERRSRRSIQDLLGVSNGSINTVIKQAGLQKAHANGEFAYAPLVSPYSVPAQVRTGAKQVKGYPLSIISQREDGSVAECAYNGMDSVPFVAAELNSGATVQVRYQIANRYVAYTDDPDACETGAKSTDTAVTITIADDQPGEGQPQPNQPRPPKKVYGPRYNPAWVRDQLKLALIITGRLTYQPYPTLTDTHTGEVLTTDPDVTPSAYTLLRLLLPDCELPAGVDLNHQPDSLAILWDEIGLLLTST